MIRLEGKITHRKITGRANLVPSKGEVMLQVKRVDPTYEEQTVVADTDDGFAGLSKVIVGPKDKPVIEVIVTDKIANQVLSIGELGAEIIVEDTTE